MHQFVVLLALFAGVVNASAWGDEGHRTIGAMADSLIAGTDAAAHVYELLGEETLSTASVWADQVKGRDGLTPEMIQFKTANPYHAVFHYTDISSLIRQLVELEISASPLFHGA